jgi:glutathione S-transferase
MAEHLTIWTYDWVPQGPRGFVRDLRLRWAAEEAGFERQPFGQVPFLTDGEITIFESGACLLHLARKSDILMPRNASGEAETLQWVVAALNSIEMVSVPWWFLGLSGDHENGLAGWLDGRLAHMEGILRDREWLVQDRFTAADLMMADVLRVPAVRARGDRPATEAYIQRLVDRPAFRKAHADQLAHFAAADGRV